MKDVRSSQRRKLWVISFTSEVRQTLADDEATISLPLGIAENNAEKMMTEAEKWSKNNIECVSQSLKKDSSMQETKKVLP